MIGVDSEIFLVAAVDGDVSSCRKIAGLDLITSCESARYISVTLSRSRGSGQGVNTFPS